MNEEIKGLSDYFNGGSLDFNSRLFKKKYPLNNSSEKSIPIGINEKDLNSFIEKILGAKIRE